MVTDVQIKTDYTTPGHPIAYSAPGAVYNFYNGEVSLNRVKDILAEIDTYTKHREFKQPKQYNPYYIYSRREQVQADLIDIRQLRQDNDGVQYLLVIINSFSRKLYVYPLQSKNAQDVSTAFQQWFNIQPNVIPRNILTDAGTEFTNRRVKALMREKNVAMHIARGQSKAGIAERVNKTLQKLIYKHMTNRETRRYIGVLPELVASYNSRGHRTLRNMSPDQADLVRNEALVRGILTQNYSKVKRKRPKFRVGDVVRIKTYATYPSSGHRSYAEQFKGEYFIIEQVKTRMPVPMYDIKSWDTGERVIGSFYSNELTGTKGDVFKIERVIRQRGRGQNLQYFVKYKDFGPRWNEWIYARQVVDVF